MSNTLDEMLKQVQIAGGGLTSVDRKKSIAEVKQAILQWVADEVVEKSGLVKRDREKQQAILKQHGWKEVES